MNKLLVGIAVFFVLSLGVATGSQASSMSQSGPTIYNTSQLIGATVKSREGVTLGQISDVVVDPQGRVDFAIVNPPGTEKPSGRLVAVPFSILTISKGKAGQTHVLFKANKEKFYDAPNWAYTTRADQKQVASVKRYFGVQPYWTEQTVKATRQ